MNYRSLIYVIYQRSTNEKVKKDFKEVFDTNTMLNHFTTLQEKHRTYRRNTNSNLQLDNALAKIEL